jgi:hypothetical protein
MHDACKVSWTFPQPSPPPCPPPPLPPCSPTRASSPPRPPPGKRHKGTDGVHVLAGNGLQTVGHCPSGLAALPRVQVFVRKPNGKSTTLYVSMGDTTECVMSAIQHKLGIPSVEQPRNSSLAVSWRIIESPGVAPLMQRSGFEEVSSGFEEVRNSRRVSQRNS